MIKVDKNYKKLVDRLPLVPIESDAHLAKAHALLIELISGVSLEQAGKKKGLRGKHPSTGPTLRPQPGKKKMTRGESQYFDVLSRLTSDYEKDIFPGEQMTPLEAFAYILESSGLSQGQMGEIMGCRQGRVSEILAGVRELSKEQIARLSAHFKVSTDLFLSKQVKITASFSHQRIT